MKYSIVQERAIEGIKVVVDRFGTTRWFTQTEIEGIGYNTLMALVNKNYLEKLYFNHVDYYRVKKV
uniref:Uncharacterized protein n=1 Tax=viral metagenome TaxID=1070528 RepID=A0A6M3M710_9ZZZZ